MLSTLRQAIYVQPWVCAAPGAAIFLTSMCFNLVSDGLRSAMERPPQMRTLRHDAMLATTSRPDILVIARSACDEATQGGKHGTSNLRPCIAPSSRVEPPRSNAVARVRNTMTQDRGGPASPCSSRPTSKSTFPPPRRPAPSAPSTASPSPSARARPSASSANPAAAKAPSPASSSTSSAPTKGELVFDGEAVAEQGGIALKDLRRQAQMVFQDSASSLNPRMPVRDSVAFGPLVLGRSRRKAAEEANESLRRVGLDPIQFGPRYPTRTLRRPETACQHSPSPGPPAPPRHPRRSRKRPRQIRRGAGPEPARHPETPARPHLHLHLPRPRRRPPRQRPRARHVSRLGRRIRRLRRGLREPPTPLHPRPSRLPPQHGPRPPCRSGAHHGRPALPRQPPQRLPLPHTLPTRRTGLHRPHPPAPHLGRAPGCLPHAPPRLRTWRSHTRRMTPLAELTDLNVRFGTGPDATHAVRGVSLQVMPRRGPMPPWAKAAPASPSPCAPSCACCPPAPEFPARSASKARTSWPSTAATSASSEAAPPP